MADFDAKAVSKTDRTQPISTLEINFEGFETNFEPRICSPVNFRCPEAARAHDATAAVAPPSLARAGRTAAAPSTASLRFAARRL